MKIKTFLTLILCGIILCGCSQKTDTVKIKFATWGSQSEIEILKPIIAEFESENPDVDVELMHIPQNYFQKIHLLFASNLAPDVIFLNNLYLPVYANAGVLEPLYKIDSNNICHAELVSVSNQLSPAEKTLKLVLDDEAHGVCKNFYDKSLLSLSHNGKLYAVPRDISNLVVYYNKDIFHKYSVPVPSKYWDFDDFLSVAKKLTKDTDKDGKTDLWGVSFEEKPALYYLPYLMSQGGGILSDDASKSIIDSPKSREGLKFYADLRNKHHVAPTKAQSASATMGQMFLQGKLAMQVSGRWLVPKYTTDAKFDWGVVNFPAGAKGSISPLDASGWAISKSSKYKNESFRLVKFLSSKKCIEKFSKSGLIVPARIDVAKGEFLHGENSPSFNKVFVDVIITSKPTPVSVDYSEVLDKLDEKTNYLFN